MTSFNWDASDLAITRAKKDQLTFSSPVLSICSINVRSSATVFGVRLWLAQILIGAGNVKFQENLCWRN
ncbi:hypothetical protein AAKU67_003870 [Oxalobacteraceae bacterium GrIS 2.11]